MPGKIINAFIADDIRIEENGKINILGLYQEVHARSRQPANMKSAMLYVTITGLEGDALPLSLEVHDHTAKASIGSKIATLKNSSKNQLHQLIVEMDGFSFPSSGPYTFNIMLGDETLYTSHISVQYPETSGDA